MTTRSPIEKLIESTSIKTIDIIKELYNSEDHKSKKTFLRIPYKRGNELRLSEQELRFIFIEQLIHNIKHNNLNLSYSIETPTSDKYIFSSHNKKETPNRANDGQSANFDLTIHSDTKMEAIIEFKANNNDYHSYAKDICKLSNKNEGDENTIRYFINILKSIKKTTAKNLYDKFSKNDLINKSDDNVDVHIICKSLNNADTEFEIDELMSFK